MGKFVTITDLARELNISHSTVSRALRRDPRISDTVGKMVRDLAEKRGYRQNRAAHITHNHSRMLIGVLVPDISMHFFSEIIKHMQEDLARVGYGILLFNTNESEASEIASLRSCLEYRVDGVIAAISGSTRNGDHFKEMLKYDIPVVLYDRVIPLLPVPKIIADDYTAAYKVTEHLIQSGCRRIAHITGSINLNNSNNRLYGYLDALRDHGHELRDEDVHYYDFIPERIHGFLQVLLSSPQPPDGLFTFNDYVANYAVNALHRLGLEVPKDIAVIGFSDEPVASYMHPKLSTVGSISEKMGKLAAQKMISILRKEESMSNEKIVISQKLVLRETTR